MTIKLLTLDLPLSASPEILGQTTDQVLTSLGPINIVDIDITEPQGAPSQPARTLLITYEQPGATLYRAVCFGDNTPDGDAIAADTFFQNYTFKSGIRMFDVSFIDLGKLRRGRTLALLTDTEWHGTPLPGQQQLFIVRTESNITSGNSGSAVPVYGDLTTGAALTVRNPTPYDASSGLLGYCFLDPVSRDYLLFPSCCLPLPNARGLLYSFDVSGDSNLLVHSSFIQPGLGSIQSSLDLPRIGSNISTSLLTGVSGLGLSCDWADSGFNYSEYRTPTNVSIGVVGSMTINVWVQIYPPSRGPQIRYGAYIGHNSFAYHLSIEVFNNFVVINAGSSFVSIGYNFVGATAGWHMVTVRRVTIGANVQYDVFIDGGIVASSGLIVDAPKNMIPEFEVFTYGRDPQPTPIAFLDQVRFYVDALSDAEILALFNAQD